MYMYMYVQYVCCVQVYVTMVSEHVCMSVGTKENEIFNNYVSVCMPLYVS